MDQTPAILGENFLLYHKSGIAGRDIGLAGTQGSTVWTKEYIFFVPDARKELGASFVKGITFGAINEGQDTPTMLNNLAVAPGLTVGGLEQSIGQFLQARGEAHLIFKISDLLKFKNKTGFMGSTQIQRPGGSSIGIGVRGVKGAKKVIHEFYGT